MENKTAIIKKVREFIGLVMSAGMQKTITVKVDSMKVHPKYDKHFLVSKKYHVHDEKNEAKVGDSVKFIECRPLSRTKMWRLIEVIKK